MKLWEKALGIAAVAAGALSTTACNEPNLAIESPRDQSIVTSPVATHISWGAINTLQNYLTVTLDGQDITNQLQLNQALILDSVDGMLPMKNGAHQMTASATLLDTQTNQWVPSNVVSNFQVVDAIFNVSMQPSALLIGPSGSVSSTVSLVRASTYTDPVTVTLTGLPAGITASALTIPAAQNSGTLTLTADANAQPGTYMIVLTGTGSAPPVSSLMFQLTVARTFTDLYNTYFAPNPATTPGHCNNCHNSGPPSTFFSPGATKDTFYQGLINAHLINQANPPASVLGSTSSSPLRWVNVNGPMPADNAVANDAAKNDVINWVNAGVLNN